MKIVSLVCRVLLALIFIVFGANHIVPFIHAPPPPPNSLPGTLLAVMGPPTGWFLIIGAFEVLGGILVLIGGTAPLGLAILAPIIVNILIYSFLVAGGGAAPGLVVAALELVLLYFYRANFAGLLTADAKPS